MESHSSLPLELIRSNAPPGMILGKGVIQNPR